MEQEVCFVYERTDTARIHIVEVDVMDNVITNPEKPIDDDLFEELIEEINHLHSSFSNRHNPSPYIQYLGKRYRVTIVHYNKANEMYQGFLIKPKG